MIYSKASANLVIAHISPLLIYVICPIFFFDVVVYCNVYIVTSLSVNSVKKLKKIESESQPVA